MAFRITRSAPYTCSPPPMEHGRWTLRLLAQRMVELQYVETLSYETVRQTLKKTRSSRI